MNIQTSWSQMDQGELISYETNLVACYEAEYLLSLQYKTNCQCTDHHNTSNHIETMEYNSSQTARVENGLELQSTANDIVKNENYNARKRPAHHDVNNNKYNKTNIDVMKQPKNGCHGWYDDGTSVYGDNSLAAVTGRLSPHVKRMCFEVQQCQS